MSKMTFFKCHEIDGDWEKKKKSPSEDQWFHLRGPWAKSDNISPGIEDRRQTCQEVLGDIWIMTRVAK